MNRFVTELQKISVQYKPTNDVFANLLNKFYA